MDIARAFDASAHRVLLAAVPVREGPGDDAAWVTEALLGEPVRIIETSGAWARVVLPLQPSHLHPDGYPGWTPSGALQESSAPPAWQTVAERTEVRGEDGWPLAELPMGSLLAANGAPLQGDRVALRLPSGERGHVALADLAGWPLPRRGRDAVLETLGIWKRQPYVWGGTNSCSGADCSGLTYRTYQRAGVTIPRDADDQFDTAPRCTLGTLEGARAGDLVFFRQPNSYRINHVGIYLGDGQYLSATQRSMGISVDPVYADRAFAGWASYLDD